MAATKRVTTATLIRGATYTLRHPDNSAANPVESLRFQRGVPVVIKDKKIADILEELYDEVGDGDGEFFEKPMFLVERGVPEPEPQNERKVTRLAADRPVRRRPRKRV